MTDRTEYLRRILDKKAEIDRAEKQKALAAADAENEKLAKLENGRQLWNSAQMTLRAVLNKLNGDLSSGHISLVLEEKKPREPALAYVEIRPHYNGQKSEGYIGLHVSAYGQIQARIPLVLLGGKSTNAETEALTAMDGEKVTSQDFERILLDMLTRDLDRRERN